eukprot:gene19614-6799_t
MSDAYAAYLQQCQRFDIRVNKTLSKQLQTDPRCIDLSRNTVGRVGLFVVLETVVTSKEVKVLDLSNCGLENDDMDEIRTLENDADGKVWVGVWKEFSSDSTQNSAQINPRPYKSNE